MFYKLFLTEFSLQMEGTFKASRLTSNLNVAWIPGDSEMELVVVVQLVLAGEVRPGPVERRPGARHPAV